jgi:hypothetical protein
MRKMEGDLKICSEETGDIGNTKRIMVVRNGAKIGEGAGAS